MPSEDTLDELVADLFALNRHAEPVENLTAKDCSGDCTDDGCSNENTKC